MDAYGFRRNPRTKDPKSGGAEWSSVWNSCNTTIQHTTSRDNVKTFQQLVDECRAYHEQEKEVVPTYEEMATDIIELIRVGLVLVEPL